jgi:hypothetical protein
VLEVAITQDPKELKKKAKNYIRSSGGRIAFVVLIIVRRLKMRRDSQVGDQVSTGFHGITNSSVSLPPLLSKCLDISDILDSNDTVQVSVFKSVFIPMVTPGTTQRKFRVVQPLIEDVEIYPRTTNASFTLAWADITMLAPLGARLIMRISLKPLSELSQRLARNRHTESDDGPSQLPREVKEDLITTNNQSVETDEEESGGTVP